MLPLLVALYFAAGGVFALVVIMFTRGFGGRVEWWAVVAAFFGWPLVFFAAVPGAPLLAVAAVCGGGAYLLAQWALG